MRHSPHDITCREMVELVTAYLDGALAPEDRDRFEAHISACDPCRAYIEQMRLTTTAARRLGEDTIGPDIRDHLLDAFRDWKRERAT